jgi:flavin-dependent dehydrogenase
MDYDVIILGGAFSGAAAAILLRRDLPQLRVLVVEKAEAFDAKVGEATTEMSAMFLTRRLAMWEHLEREHLPKEGLRYWFQNDKVTGHADASEMGGTIRSAVPSFQLRRDVLDEHLLATAVREGAELLRPAKAVDAVLGDFEQTITVESEEGQKPLTCRWLLDATGRVTFLGRRLGLIDRNEAHPTAAIWCRWKNVRHIDDFAARGPLKFSRGNVSSRRLGTNHYTGFGYWVWFIPLGNGETSIGIVFDKRYIDLHKSLDRQRDYLAFLHAIPSCRELIEGAELRTEDLKFYASLPYVTRQYMGNGWALLGDAAAFMDPYYSPGLDHASFSVEATVDIIRKDVEGENLAPLIAEHNASFVRSYHRFFDAVYVDKYTYMGEHDLLSAAAILDTAQYYIFMVMPAYRIFGKFVSTPVLGPPQAWFSYNLMRLYNYRFKVIALARKKYGTAGARNNGRRIRAYFDLGFSPFRMNLRGMRIWAAAELDLVWLRFAGLFKRRVTEDSSTARERSHVIPGVSEESGGMGRTPQ